MVLTPCRCLNDGQSRRQLLHCKAQQAPQPGLLTGLLEAIQAGFQQQAKEALFTPASLDVRDLVSQPPGGHKSGTGFTITMRHYQQSERSVSVNDSLTEAMLLYLHVVSS